MIWFKVLGPPILLTIVLVLYNEYFIFYNALSDCDWPCRHGRCLESSLKVFMISDTHLLGKINGHWLDKLKREWQMYQSFWIAKWIHNPEFVFFLGDLMDEGKWAGKPLFSSYADRFRQLFGDDNRTITLAGNHDIGFHYAVMPDTLEMFNKEFRRGLVDDIELKGHRFILINSMALHGDGCRLCLEAEMELDKIQRNKSKNRPIVLQHFPLYRKSDAVCEKIDEQDKLDLNETYREQWDTLSKESSRKLINSLNPKAVFNGHTHKMCKKRWKTPEASAYFYEYTVNSFSWRNGDVPSMLLVVIEGDNVRVRSCRLPSEIQQITVYVVGGVAILVLVIILTVKRSQPTMTNTDIVLPPPLQWDWNTMATCAAIIIVMVVNIIGLVFTIFWCLSSKDEGIEVGSNGAAVNQFVEPNIRMKLKMGKVDNRTDEMFEVRVPSNGNQYNACHETTIMVARNKRRRTYSLPLESRPRTQSTISQQLTATEI